MRYWVGFVLALGLVASPLRVSAQEGEEGAASGSLGEETKSSQSWLERTHPEAFEVPAVTKSDSGIGMEHVPVPPPWLRVELGAESQELALVPLYKQPKRSRGARIAMGVMIPVLVGAVTFGIVGGIALSQINSIGDQP